MLSQAETAPSMPGRKARGSALLLQGGDPAKGCALGTHSLSKAGSRAEPSLAFRPAAAATLPRMTPPQHGYRTGRAAILCAAALVAVSAAACAAERCRFEGTTDHAGRVVADTLVTTAPDGERTVDVTLDLRATAWWLLDVRYLVEEITTWRGDTLRQVAVNTRSLAGERVVRQSWDVFRRDGDSLQAWRVQAKTAAGLRDRHPGFQAHWDTASFGTPWLGDYDAARPERRPDLDLAHAAPSLRTPLALAFHWSRWLPDRLAPVPVFLPGFKRDASLTLDPAPAPSSEAPGLWRVPLRHPALDAAGPSEADASVSADHRLLGLSFVLHAAQGSAHGTIHAAGCSGNADGAK